MSFRLNDNYTRNITTISVATLISQFIPLIFYPILSRLYTPTEFGLASTILAISSICSVLFTLKYELAILLIKNTYLAAQFVIGIISICGTFAILLFFIFYFNLQSITFLFDNVLIGKFLLFCPLIGFCVCIYQIYNEWTIRCKQFHQLSINKVINSSSVTIGKYIFSFVSQHTGLIIGEILGRFISAICCIVFVFRKEKHYFSIISIRKIKILLHRFRNFPIYVLPSQLLNTFGGQMPVFFIGILYTQQNLGFFSMAMFALYLPSSIITLAVRDVFRQRATEEIQRSGNCRKTYVNTMKWLAIISLCGFSVFAFISIPLFRFALGDDWVTAGLYARIITPIVAVSFVTEVGSALYYIKEANKQLLVWQICYFCCSVLPFIVAKYLDLSIENALLYFCITMVLLHLYNLLITYKLAVGK